MGYFFRHNEFRAALSDDGKTQKLLSKSDNLMSLQVQTNLEENNYVAIHYEPPSTYLRVIGSATSIYINSSK